MPFNVTWRLNLNGPSRIPRMLPGEAFIDVAEVSLPADRGND